MVGMLVEILIEVALESRYGHGGFAEL